MWDEQGLILDDQHYPEVALFLLVKADFPQISPNSSKNQKSALTYYIRMLRTAKYMILGQL